MLYPKEVGEHCSLLNLASNALLCIWSRSACRRGVGRRVYLCTSRGSCLKLCVCLENNLFLLLLLLFSPSSGIGSHCWEHSVIPGCQIFVCCWAGVQGVVPGDVGRDAVEEAHWENGQDRLPVEGFVREERMVRKLNLHLFCPPFRTGGVVCFKPYLKRVIHYTETSCWFQTWQLLTSKIRVWGVRASFGYMAMWGIFSSPSSSDHALTLLWQVRYADWDFYTQLSLSSN